MRTQTNPQFDKVPPQNLEAEQSVLGSMMIAPSAINEAGEVLTKDMFYRMAHGLIFHALMQLHLKNEPVDIVTVQEELRLRKELDDVGGTEYLMALIDSVPTAANARYYADIVKAKWLARQGIDICAVKGSELYTTADPHDTLGHLHQEVLNLERCIDGTVITPMIAPVYQNYEAICDARGKRITMTGIPTGSRILNRFTGGWQDGDLIILAARPSQGKTALMIHSALAAAKAGFPTAIFSLEMDKLSVAYRLLAHECRIDSRSLRTGNLNDDEWAVLADNVGKLETSRVPLYIYDKPSLHINEFSMLARRAVSEFKVRFILIDYLTLLNCDSLGNRNQEVGNMAKVAKETARTLHLPVVMIAQLNRTVANSLPTMEAIRDSGEVEAHADVIIGLHNPPPMDKESINQSRVAEVLILKQRNGITGKVELNWTPQYQRFDDIETERQEPEDWQNKAAGGD